MSRRAWLLIALALVPGARGQEAAPPVGPAREVIVTPLRGDGLGLRLTLPSAAPEGAVMVAALLEEQQPPPISMNQAGVRGGEVVVILRFAARPAPGLYEAHVLYDPTAQPRWVPSRGPPGRREVPVVLGTVAEAQAGRDQAVAAAADCADALVAVAAEVAQGFGPRAAPWTRSSLQDWVRARAVPRAQALEVALQGLRTTRLLAREDAALRSLGGRALEALAARARAACLEHEVALPSAFADAGQVTGAGQVEEALLVEALVARDVARRRALAPEPSPLTLERLTRRAAALALVARRAAPDTARPEVLAYLLEDARLAVSRLRPAVVAARDPRAPTLAAALAEDDADLARARPDPDDVAERAARWRGLVQRADDLQALVRRLHLAEDRAALAALRARVAEAGGDPATAAAWRRALTVVERRLASSPAPARALAAALAEAGAATAARRPAPAEVERRWTEALAAVDALLGATR
ncbi:MAG: hypothetical protein M9894_33640 [Planctomycetes bacterium]|nr:hypothetical protein [Planctomycetota bacterium]